ncbi:MAG: membrane protein insertase YidC [Chloroflexi bacterium]|nr:membrane protein insertase YidC [Chloroflexota bacterium]
MDINLLWNELLMKPMLNSLIVLYYFLFHNLGITIIAFTFLVRTLMLPLTLKQLHASKSMSALSPRLQELQKKYAKDKQRLSEETMRLYREQGVNPAGCLLPTVIQFPIWIGLYYSLIQAIGSTPEALRGLSTLLYTWLPLVHEALPLNSQFLWLDLALPDPSPFLLPVLVGGTMWIQQKMMTVTTGDPKQESMNRMMLTMMPLMFGVLTIQFPSGLAIYWVTSNVVSIVMQYFVTGWGSLPQLKSLASALGLGKPGATVSSQPVQEPAATSPPDKEQGVLKPVGVSNLSSKSTKRIAYGKSRGKRQNSKRSRRPGSGATGG